MNKVLHFMLIGCKSFLGGKYEKKEK